MNFALGGIRTHRGQTHQFIKKIVFMNFINIMNYVYIDLFRQIT